MRSQPKQHAASPLALVLTFVPVLFLASVANASPATGGEFLASILKRDEHGHHNAHAAPLLELNETEVTLYHAPTPPSYYTLDWEGTDGTGVHYPGLIVMHAVFMCLAFFVALPIGIAMRSVKHSGHWLTVVTFYGLCALGCATGGVYTKLTPNMYEGSVHGSQGYLVLLLALSLSTVDILSVLRRIATFFRSKQKFSLKTFWTSTLLGRDRDSERHPLPDEYTGLVVEDPEEFEETKVSPSPIRGSSDLGPRPSDDFEHGNAAQWANDVHRHNRHHRQQSTASDGTLFGSPSSIRSLDKIQEVKSHSSIVSNIGFLRKAGNIMFAILERFLVFAGLTQLLTGIVIYTGGCRENYVNGCLAHLIKGAIFWSYGLLSFARFLGSFAELGWAWNRAPNSDSPSAEFVESLVIFVYGATNMWMERFGANPGDPFTTKQIQHIGIAVMFCFAGLVGMGIESKRVRRWLAASTFASISSTRVAQEAISEPISYTASFNPFPALVIGVTGAAMAAHTQTYLFQVEIHALWGNLLLGFSVLRCLTYFFLWLGPPRSILPSRPPTEALGSFFLACGGLVFMLSTEEVTIAAMRRGRDDVMMFLNVAVAITCFALCWTLFVVGFKGWLKSRNNPLVTYRSSA